MFEYAKFEKPAENVDVSQWNTANVWGMAGMFAHSWAEYIEAGSWDTGRVG
jgi:hypothetical protein